MDTSQLRSPFTAAVVCAALGCISFIAALASSAWMKGCVDYGQIFEHISDNAKHLKSNPETTVLCINQGLFRINVNLGYGMEYSIAVGGDVGVPASVVAAAIGGVVLVLLSFSAVLVLISAATANTTSYERKGIATHRALIGIILLIIAGFVGIAGMSAYTAQSHRDSHDPALFANQLESNFENMFRATPTSGTNKDTVEEFSTMMLFDLHYAYAFVLGWTAVALVMLAAGMAVWAKQCLISQSYYDNDPISM